MLRYVSNKVFGLVSLLFLVLQVNGQDPYYSQYYNNPIYYNPAMTGLTNGMKVRLSYRNQWPQYSHDLKNYGFTMDVAERFLPGAGGVGLIFDTSKEGKGLIKRTMVGGTLATRIRMSRNWVSQLGGMVAYVQKSIDRDDFIWSDQLDGRHGLLYPYSSFEGFAEQYIGYADISLGYVAHYEEEYKSLTLGAAVHHLLKPNESFYNLETRVPRKYVLSADMVIFQISNPKQGFKFNPGILYENQAGFNTFTLGINVSKSVLFAGGWYRNKQSQIYNYQSLILVAGINIPMVNKYSRMKLMYSYDISVTEMNGTGGTHEITLRFEFDQIHLIRSQDHFANEYPIIYDPVIF